MRILHVIPRYPPAIGGVERWCAGVARWQAGQGHAVRVLTLRAVEDDELWGDLWSGTPRTLGSVAVGATDVQDGVSVCRCRHSPPSVTLLHLLRRLHLEVFAWGHSAELYGRLLREARRADTVHAHWMPGIHAYAAWLAARAARTPFVVTPHFHVGDPYHEHPVVRWVLRHADRVIAVTRSEADGLAVRGVSADRIVCASNAIDPEPLGQPLLTADGIRASLRVPPDAPLLCYLGRKSSAKSLDVLLRAMPLLRYGPPPFLALAGPSTEWFQGLLRTAPCRDRIRDLPTLTESAKAALLAASDLLVLPSRREAFGIVFLEAWAAGTAVVGADIPAVREVIADAGFLFRPDDAEHLAACIDEALADGDRRRVLAARGRERLGALHTWDRVGAQVLSAYPLPRPRGATRAPAAAKSPSWR